MELFRRFALLFSNPPESFFGLTEKPLSGQQVFFALSLIVLSTVVFSYWSASDPVLQHEMIIQKQKEIDKQVEKKLMTAEQGEITKKSIEAQIESNGYIWGPIAYALNAIFVFFISAFYYYLIGSFVYKKGKYLFSTGLSLVSVLSILLVLKIMVNNSLQIGLGNFHSSLGISLLISNYQQDNWLHLLFSGLDVFSVAYCYLLVVGFKITTETKWMTAILTVLIPYVFLTAFSIYMSLN